MSSSITETQRPGLATETPISVDLRPGTLFYGRHLPHYLVLATVTFIVWYWFWDTADSNVDVPRFKAAKLRWIFQADKLARESYNQFRGRCYQISTIEGTKVMVPPHLIAELKGLPEDTLSAAEAVDEALMSKYTNFSPGDHGSLLAHVVRTNVAQKQRLARLAPTMLEELEHLCASDFPTADDWTNVQVQPFTLRAVARISGRMLVGPQLCRNDAWTNVAINYAVHVFMAVVKLQLFPAWLRPLGQYLVSDIRYIHRDVSTAIDLIAPQIEARIMALDRAESERRRRQSDKHIEQSDHHGRHDNLSESNQESDTEKPNDFIQWLLEALPEHERGDVRMQTELQLILAAASIHTTNNLLTDCVIDLATHTDMQVTLRDEVQRVLHDNGGGWDSWAHPDTFGKLTMMDSFIKESQRLGGNTVSFIRKVCKPITLSDGTFLPPGTQLLASLRGISHDPQYLGIAGEITSPRSSGNSPTTSGATPCHKAVGGLPEPFVPAKEGDEDEKEEKDNQELNDEDGDSETLISPSDPPSTSSSATFPPAFFNSGASPSGNSATNTFPHSDVDDLTPQSPDEFDGLRFYKLRHQHHHEQQPPPRSSTHSNSTRWQVTSLTDSDLNFGAGRHACPGRFFAAGEIKTILAFLLTRYEMRLEPPRGTGAAEAGNAARPKSVSVMMSRSPHPASVVQFRRLRSRGS